MRSAGTDAGSTSISWRFGGLAAFSAIGSVRVAVERARRAHRRRASGPPRPARRRARSGSPRLRSPDPGPALAAGLRPLHPGLVDGEGEAAPLLAEELGEVAAAGERAVEDAGGERPRRPGVILARSLVPRPAGPATSIRREAARNSARPSSESSGKRRSGPRVVRPCEWLAQVAAPAQVGSGLVRVARDAVEQQAVGLGRH